MESIREENERLREDLYVFEGEKEKLSEQLYEIEGKISEIEEKIYLNNEHLENCLDAMSDFI